jgi:hypothetical protein
MTGFLRRICGGWPGGSAFGAAIAILLGAGAFTISPAGARVERRLPRAHATRTLNSTDTAHLHLTRASGSTLDETGPVSGALPGSMRAELTIGAAFSGNFTIYTHLGTIKGHGTATPSGSGRYESFDGSIVVNGGSGVYAHVHGHGGLDGTFDRRTYAFVIRTTGKLSY